MSTASVVKLTRSMVIPVMLYCGWKIANKWDNAKIAGKLPTIKDVKPEEEPEDESVRDVLTQILDGIDVGATFEVVDDEGTVSETKETKKKDKKESKPAEPKAPRKTAPQICGEVFRELGYDKGVTDEVKARYAELRGRSNPGQDAADLDWAYKVIVGYSN